MKRRDRAEMSLVEAQDARGLVSRRKGHERAVGEAEIEIGVARVQVDDRGVVGALQIADREAPRSQIGKEGTSRPKPNRRPRG